MPIAEVTKVLIEKGGLKEGDPILKEVTDTYDLAGAAQKIKDANKDLTTQREAWETEKKTLKSVTAEAETLKGQIAKLTEGNEGGKNTLEINRLQTELTTVTTAFNSFKTEAESAKREAKEEKMRSSVLTLASTSKAINPDEVFTLMRSAGAVQLNDKGETIYARKNAKGEMEKASAEEAVTAFLEVRPYLVSSSGRKGAGGGPGAGAGAESFNPFEHLNTRPKQ